MTGCCGLDRLPPGGAQQHCGPPPVLRAGAAAEQPSAFHPGELVGGSAVFPTECPADVRWADDSFRGLRQSHEHREVLSGQPGSLLHPALEVAEQLVAHREERPPARLLGIVEPRYVVVGDRGSARRCAHVGDGGSCSAAASVRARSTAGSVPIRPWLKSSIASRISARVFIRNGP